MLNLSRRVNNLGKTKNQIADAEISELKLAQPNKLPRHLSVLESPTHSRKDYRSLFQTVRQCPLKQQDRSAEATNLAVNILQYQLRDTVTQHQHLDNLRSNLQHRLEVAQAENNERLVTLLWQEFEQLEASI